MARNDDPLDQPQPRLPSINDDKLGYGSRFSSNPRPRTTLLGHPEVAGQYVFEHEPGTQHLEGNARRIDMEYDSAELRRIRAKGGF